MEPDGLERELVARPVRGLRPHGHGNTVAHGANVNLVELLVSSVADYAIFVLDVDGRIASWNRGAEKLKGYGAEEVVGRHLSIFFADDDSEDRSPDRELAIAVAAGQVENEGWLVRKDGSRFWANVIITALRDEAGALVGFGVVTRDLTERKRADDDLRESEERFRLLVSGVSDYAIFLLDPDGRVSSWNLGVERLKGYRADEILGRHFSQFYTQDDQRSGLPQSGFREAEANGRWENEGWRVRKDGSRFWADVVITALHGADGQLRGFAKVTRDLTERKQGEDALRGILERERAAADQLRAVDAMRRELVTTVAHDLRGPVAVTEHLLDLLLDQWDELDDAQRRKKVERARGRVEALGALTDDVFDISLIDAGRLEVTEEHIDVGALIQRAVQRRRVTRRHRSDQRERGGRCACGRRRGAHLAGAHQPAQQCPEVQPRRTRRRVGGPIRTPCGDRRPRRRPGDRARGPGEDLRPLHKVAPGGSHSRNRARSLHRSEPGRGSGGHGHRQLQPRARGRPSGSRSRRRRRHVRTVIIDDDPDHREVVRTLLERAGLGPVTEAQDGRTGLRAVEAAAPELVLLDIGLPGPSGLDILDELVRVAPAARIVILSNFPRSLHGETATARGAAGYVEKRVAMRDLVREILLAAAITETALEVAAELPAELSSIRMARTLVRDALGDSGDDVLYALELLVSEVVTNALKHAASAPRIVAQLTPETIRVAVYDAEPTLPVHRVPDQDRPGGRGLLLLDRLASRWGTDSTETGKVVWFELDRS